LELKDLRLNRGLTQGELAGRLAMKQAAVSKLETRTDLYVSMLRSFIEALGGKMEITTVFPDASIPISGFDQGGVMESLRGLQNRQCRLHPMPTERAEDTFLISRVDDSGIVELQKQSNMQTVEIPIRRIFEVLPATSTAPPTLVLHGKLAWSANKQVWEFLLS